MRSSAGLGLNGLLPTVDNVISVDAISLRSEELILRSITFRILRTYLYSGASNGSKYSGHRNLSYFSPTLFFSFIMAMGNANEFFVDAAVHYTPTPATPTQTPATPRGALSAPGEHVVLDGEKASCHVWKKRIPYQSLIVIPELPSAGNVISIYYDHDNLGRRDASRRAGMENAVALGSFIEVGVSVISCRVNGGSGNGGMAVGEVLRITVISLGRVLRDMFF